LRQARQQLAHVGWGEAADAALGADEGGLEGDERVAAVRLEEDERAAGAEHATDLVQRGPWGVQVVQQVAHEHAGEGGRAKGEREGVRGEHAGAGNGARRETHLAGVVVDADRGAAARQPREIRALAAAHLEAGEGERREARQEEPVFDRSEARILRGPAEVGGIDTRRGGSGRQASWEAS